MGQLARLARVNLKAKAITRAGAMSGSRTTYNQLSHCEQDQSRSKEVNHVHQNRCTQWNLLRADAVTFCSSGKSSHLPSFEVIRQSFILPFLMLIQDTALHAATGGYVQRRTDFVSCSSHLCLS
jgi:hypothetical protein